MTDLKYPMVDLITGPAMMSLMYANIVMAWYLMLLNAPWLFMQAMMQGLESERGSLPARTVQGPDRADSLINASASQGSTRPIA
jgi:hypothetical protein